MNDELLVMSVYGARSYKWYEIQIQALQQTTNNFKHAVYLNNPASEHEYPHSHIVGGGESDLYPSLQHFVGLQELLKFAKSSGHTKWLFLDCDCFPIDNYWQDILTQNSAIVRPENLDVFAHPSAVYVLDGNVDFIFDELSNLRGEIFKELHAIGSFFPLLRTNKINHHPLLYGVYYDLFYHHGAGSRDNLFRTDTYYGRIPEITIPDDIFKFANELKMGIHNHSYNYI